MRYLLAIAALGLAAPAQAATTIFTENFDGYAPNQGFWGGDGEWTTGNSVDLVESGSFALTCVGGAGNCVDLSSTFPGSISRVLNLAAGFYSLTFQFTGNQLGAPATSFDVSFNGVTSTVGPLAGNSAAFQTFTNTYNVLTSGPVTLSFVQNPGGDTNRGNIIDSIVVAEATVIAAVPEPTTWALMILGFGIVGSALRRRRRQVSAKISFA